MGDSVSHGPFEGKGCHRGSNTAVRIDVQEYVCLVTVNYKIV